MDSLTHIVLGGCIGDAVARKELGKKALVVGALSQSLPDIDFVASFWLNPANDLLAHRGFTHSFLFVLLAAPVLALVVDKFIFPRALPVRTWTAFFGVQIFMHIFLDAFNSYGVGWFEPFSHSRISFDVLFVADPFFSVVPTVAMVILLLRGPEFRYRKALVRVALLWCAAYLVYGMANKYVIHSNIRKNLTDQRIEADSYFSTPTPLNTWLWYIVVNTDNGSYVGFRSVFDSQEKIDFEFFDRGDSLLAPVNDHEDVQHLRRFAQGFYTAEMWGDTLVFNDLRFGQMVGWKERRGHFVFHYFINHPEDNKLVVQRGRFDGWDREATISFLRRIRGN
ncbi:MAG: metal-dependent hydrolase [Cytophagales bacterium]|nr:metal-dependent hydrolase [Cytophagales bacterium]